jgi:hypothetical protein
MDYILDNCFCNRAMWDGKLLVKEAWEEQEEATLLMMVHNTHTDQIKSEMNKCGQ